MGKSPHLSRVLCFIFILSRVFKVSLVYRGKNLPRCLLIPFAPFIAPHFEILRRFYVLAGIRFFFQKRFSSLFLKTISKSFLQTRFQNRFIFQKTVSKSPHLSRVLRFIFVLSRVFKSSQVYPQFVKSARYIPCLSHQAQWMLSVLSWTATWAWNPRRTPHHRGKNLPRCLLIPFAPFIAPHFEILRRFYVFAGIRFFFQKRFSFLFLKTISKSFLQTRFRNHFFQERFRNRF